MTSARKILLGVAASAVALLSANSLQAQGTATTCKDGTTSASSGRGACSGHGGVDRKAPSRHKKVVKSETKAAKEVAKKTEGAPIAAPVTAASPRAAAPVPRASAVARTRASANSAVAGSGAPDDKNPAGAIARCKDGLYSHARDRRGACSRHGGVASWI